MVEVTDIDQGASVAADLTQATAGTEESVGTPQVEGEGETTDQGEASLESEAARYEAAGELDIEKLPADVQPLAKRLVASHTRRTQKLADQRRELEETGTLGSWASGLQELAKTDPAAAAAQLEQAAGTLRGGQPKTSGQAPTGPDWESMTDGERYIAGGLWQMHQDLQAVKQAQEKTQVEQAVALLEVELDGVDQLAKERGWPAADRDEIKAYMRQNGVGNPRTAYMSLYGEDLYAAGEKQALARVQGKRRATVPSPASVTPSAKLPTDIASIWAEAERQQGGK